MSKPADLIGKRFGKLTVLSKAGLKRVSGRTCSLWSCRCDCGNEIVVLGKSLSSGNTKSCGCLAKTDLTGKKVGRLTVLSPTEKRTRQGHIIWECKCDCGKTAYIQADNLTSGKTRSCGCLADETKKCLGRRIRDSRESDYVDGTDIKGLLAPPQANNKSGVTGVCYEKRRGLWLAYISFKRHRYNLGAYKEKSEAIKTRKEAEQRIHGEFLEWYYSTHPDKKPKDPPPD